MKKLVILMMLILGLCAMNASISAYAEEEQVIKVELEDNLIINASISTPNTENLKEPVIHVRKFVPNAELAQQVLFPQKNPINILTNEDYPDYRLIQFDKGEYLAINTGYIDSATQTGEVIRQLYSLEWLINAHSLEHPDLAFAKRDQIKEEVINKLTRMGFANLQCVDIYALSTDQLQNAADHLYIDPSFEEDIKEGRIAFKRIWTVDDECYVLKIQSIIGENSIPVFSNDSNKSFSLSEVHYESCEIEVVVSKDGIIAMRASNVVQELSEDNAELLLPAEKVVDYLSEYYKNIIVESPTVVSKIALYYTILPVEGENAYDLIPTWCCRVDSQYGYESEAITEWIVFDARNGRIYY